MVPGPPLVLQWSHPASDIWSGSQGFRKQKFETEKVIFSIWRKNYQRAAAHLDRQNYPSIWDTFSSKFASLRASPLNKCYHLVTNVDSHKMNRRINQSVALSSCLLFFTWLSVQINATYQTSFLRRTKASGLSSQYSFLQSKNLHRGNYL